MNASYSTPNFEHNMGFEDHSNGNELYLTEPGLLFRPSFVNNKVIDIEWIDLT